MVATVLQEGDIVGTPSGYVLTANGLGLAATFQAAGGGGQTSAQVSTAISTQAVSDSTSISTAVSSCLSTAESYALSAVLTTASITTSNSITGTVGQTQYELTSLSTAVSIAAPTGSPVDGQQIIYRIKDGGAGPFAITMLTTAGNFRAVGVTLPTTTVGSKVLYIGCIYNGQDSLWDVVAVAEQ